MTRQNHILEPEDLMAYLDGELQPDRASEAAAHLAECKECQRLAAELEEISRTMLVWEVEASSSRLEEEVAAAFSEPEVKKAARTHRWKPRFLRWPWALKLAGVGIVAALLLAALVLHNVPQPQLVQQKEYEPLKPSASPRAPLTLYMPREGLASRDIGGKVLRYSDAGQSSEGRGSAGKLVTQRPESTAATSGPMIVHTATLAVVSGQFDAVRARLDQIVGANRGYIAQLTANSPTDNGRSVSGTIRVPATRLDQALAELKTLGRVETENQNGQEVTAEYVDLEARLTNARNTEQRLTDILRNRTGRLSDVLEVEQEIDRVRGEIEQMQAQKKNLKDQVDLASINFSIKEDYKAQLKVVPPSTGTRYRYAVVAGYRLMMDSLIEISLWLLAWLPTLLVWTAVLFFPVRLAWRKLRARVAQ